MEEQNGAAGKHQTRLRVRYAETDQMGVVYHANYLVWMEIGRVELVRARGLSYKELEGQGLLLAVVESNCRYRCPARYDQQIVVQAEVLEMNPRVIRFGYQIRCEETERMLADGWTRHVWLNRQWRPSRLPDKYLEALR